MPEFAFLDPHPPTARSAPGQGNRGRRAPRAPWKPWLGQHWRPIAAASTSRLREAGDADVLSHAGLWLHIVELALVDVIAPRGSRSASRSLWCAAQALDASAVVWRHFEQRPNRYRVLVELVDARLAQQRPTPPSATAAAVALRTTQQALRDLAAGTGPRGATLRSLDDGVASLAALAVEAWLDARDERRPDSVADGFDAALAIAAPDAELELLGRRTIDRVLRADALLVVRRAWSARGARELLVLHALRHRHPDLAALVSVPVGTAADPGRQDIAGRPVVPAIAWGRHAVTLARAATTHARQPDDDAVRAQVARTMSELVLDSVSQLTILDALLAHPDAPCRGEDSRADPDRPSR